MSPTTLPTLNREAELHWLALMLTPGLGSRRAADLVRNFRTVQALFRASQSELLAAGASPGVARAISEGQQWDEAGRQQQRLLELKAELIALGDARYPERLRQIYDPPVVLFAQGRVELLQRPMLAIVGSRKATPYGTAATTRLATDLARRGLLITSGMAAGIDSAAHHAALEAGEPTVAVFGCGLDVVYPAYNRKLAERIADNGLILSEFPLGTPAYPQNFPVRNRIVSGLSVGVLVVEGSQYSGSAITARLALDQDREVFAVPGNITSPASWVPNLLIKQGAHLVQTADDVLEALPADASAALAVAREPSPQACLRFGVEGPLQTQLLDLIGVDTPVSLDSLVDRIEDSSPSEVIAALLEMELAGQVRQLPGKTFVRVWV